MNRTEAPSLFLPCIRQAGAAHLSYTLYRAADAYGLLICSDETKEDRIQIDDIARDLTLAKRIQALFAENLVFPSNVPEVLDDLLGIWQGI